MPTARSGGSDGTPPMGIFSVQLARRAFLAAAGVGGAALLATPLAVSAARRAGMTQATTPPGAPVVDAAIDDLAASLDYDIEKLFRFVADEVRYEPYPGILRGAAGTLAGRAGNAADQALLLGALLDAAAVPYRFAVGALDGARAAALLAATSQDAAAANDDAMQILVRDAGANGAPTVPTLDAETQALVDKVAGASQAVVDMAAAQLKQGLDTIVTALAAAGISVPAGTSGLPASESSQHIWVQIGSGAEWIDADPTLPGSQQGQALTTADQTMDVLPDTLRHTVDFEVVAETASAGALVEATILTHTAFADAIALQPVTFLNSKPGGLQALGMSISSALGGGIQYLAALSIGGTTTVGLTPLTFSSGDGIFAAPTGAGPAEGEAIAEWLDISVTPPGGAPVKARREIFDRVGAAARASGPINVTTIAPIELVDLGTGNADEYLPLSAVRSIAVVTGPISVSYLAAQDRPADAVSALTVLAHTYHYVRDALAATSGIPLGVRQFCDGPAISSLLLAPGLQPDGKPAASFDLDLWHRSFGALPVTGTPTPYPPAIVAGVVSHVAESIANGSWLSDDAGPEVPATVSVAEVFAEAARLGTATRLVGGTVPADLPYGPEANARIGTAVAGGRVVIIPEAPVDLGGRARVGWWQVDPATGATTDQMDDGRGEAEYTIPLSWEFRAAACFIRWGGILFAIAALVAKILDANTTSYALGAGGIAAAIAKELARAALKSPGTC